MTFRPRSFRVGSMRERITIQTKTETQDDAGQPVVTWANYLVNEPCEYRPTSGGETLRGRQVEEGTKAVFTVRYRDGYSADQQIVHNGSIYGITYVKPVEGGRRYIELIVMS